MQQRVKIVATLGPASTSAEIIARMIQAGLDVARLNFSHGEHEAHEKLFRTVRKEAQKQGRHVAVLADLCGPKIRAGKIEGGSVELVAGGELTITTEAIAGTAGRISTNYRNLPRDVQPGSRILLDDGLLELEVLKVDGSEVRCRVIVGGTLGENKGMNIPDTSLSTPAITEKDRADIAFARELGVDYFALSFVRHADDVRTAKALAGGIPVVAKIEKPEALHNLDAILEAADGVMVARGDLGVEAGAEKVPLLQKHIIEQAADRGLPVIVATQMLDSMIRNPRPTRAEVSDVANAVLDGTDAVMLSGETAVGRYPVEAVRTMTDILVEMEGSDYFKNAQRPAPPHEYSFSNAIARAAVTAAADLSLTALAVYTETGHSAALVSCCRPYALIVGFSRHEKVLRRMALRWGVLPLKADWVERGPEVVEQAEQVLLENGRVQPGDDIVVTFGRQNIDSPSRTDMLKLWRVRPPGTPQPT